MELSQCITVLFLAVLYPPMFVSPHTPNPLVLLVSFDGFRWDYLDMVKKANKQTPAFDMLRSNGSTALNGIKNVFATKTFPNHYSLVTGMYETSHGVVGNEFYDPIRKVVYSGFNATQRSDPYYWNNGTQLDQWKGEPIWITNQKASTPILRRDTGAMMWVGCDVQIKGQYPSRYMPFTRDFSPETKIDQVVQWFTDRTLPINLGLLYFDQPDHLGHLVGPNSPEMIDMIVTLDGVLGYLVEKLREHNLFDQMNLIVTSDHGMAETKEEVFLEDYLDSSLYLIVGGTPVAHVWPNEGKEQEVYQQLKTVPHIQTYLKKDIPKEYRYTFHHRVPPILVTSEEGYNVFQTRQNESILGEHGYNNSLPSMHPFFIAHGPAFKRDYTFKKQFHSVDIYPLMCHILDIQPAEHDGSLDEVKHILASEKPEGEGEEIAFFSTTVVTFMLVMVFGALISGVFCVAAFRTSRIHMRRLQLRLRVPAEHPMNGLGTKEREVLLLDSEEEEDELP